MAVGIVGAGFVSAAQGTTRAPLYTYTLGHSSTWEGYDEALAAACLQGIINEDAPEVYLLSRTNDRPRFWLDVLIAWFYETASAADTFTSDASAAGYMNPNRIGKQYLPLFVKHNQRFFSEADMSMAPMVLDWDEPKKDVKDAFRQFAPDGFATIVMDLHGNGGKAPEPQVWRGMPVTELINDACNFAGPSETAEIMSRAITARGQQTPGFYFFRIVWVSPTDISKTIAALRRRQSDIELVDPRNFFALFRLAHERRDGGPAKASE